MPPFRLEPPDRDPRHKFLKRHFVAKQIYNEKVLMPDWDEYIESHPFDANPLREGNVNHFVSHYDRLGLEKSDWLTTTQLMLDGGRVRNDSKLDGEDKCMVNFISFKESLPCEGKSSFCADYSTTMQSSYAPPYPYPMKRLAMAKVPFLKYRKLQNENCICEEKFLDDKFLDRTRNMIRAKGDRFVSYNPLTGLSSDGSPVSERKQVCYMLDF